MRNKSVAGKPQDNILDTNSSSASVKVVRIKTQVEMGNRCSNCSCVCEKVSSLQNCRARMAISYCQPASRSSTGIEPQAGGASDPKKRRLSNLSVKTPSRKIEVITVSDDDEDSTTIKWETSSSEEDVQVLDQRIRNRKVARQYQDKDKEIHTRIFKNSSTRRFKQGRVSTSRNTCKDITKVGGSSFYARFKQGGASTSRKTLFQGKIHGWL